MRHLSNGMIFGLLASALAVSAISVSPWLQADDNDLAQITQDIAGHVTAQGSAYDDLRELTVIGPRLSGSENAAVAVDWAKSKLESLGLDRVWLQPMQAPKWERGSTEIAILQGQSGNIELAVAALGNSVGTVDGGVTASVIEVQSLAQVESLGEAIRGKIVFYNRAMDASLNDTFAAYGGAVDQRSSGPAYAARYGAAGVLVRSMTTLPDDDHPHTGITSYEINSPMIPAAALSTHAANILSQNLARDPQLTVHLELSSRRFGMVPSFNVIGEIRGSDKPDEIIVVGGHLDSWDLGPGAHDDGAGVVQAIEVLRVLKNLGIRPKRTIRVVLFMSEEFGGFGGREYADEVRRSGERHIMALESDRGGFAPVGFSVNGQDATFNHISSWAPYLSPINSAMFVRGGGGTDIDPLNALGVPTVGFIPESTHYFDFHHSALDTFDVIDRGELQAGAAAMAVFAFLASETGME